MPTKDRNARIAFYANHGIGWVARPKHDDTSPDGFKRAGRFKKASNMNFGLALSLKLEKHLSILQERLRLSGLASHTQNQTGVDTTAGRASAGSGVLEEQRYGMQYQNQDAEDQGMVEPNLPGVSASVSGSNPAIPPMGTLRNSSGNVIRVQSNEWADLEEKALQAAIEETYEASGNKFRPWAANGRAIRMGEIVLLVDSDTIVPEVRVGIPCIWLSNTNLFG